MGRCLQRYVRQPVRPQSTGLVDLAFFFLRSSPSFEYLLSLVSRLPDLSREKYRKNLARCSGRKKALTLSNFAFCPATNSSSRDASSLLPTILENQGVRLTFLDVGARRRRRQAAERQSPGYTCGPPCARPELAAVRGEKSFLSVIRRGRRSSMRRGFRRGWASRWCRVS